MGTTGLSVEQGWVWSVEWGWVWLVEWGWVDGHRMRMGVDRRGWIGADGIGADGIGADGRG